MIRILILFDSSALFSRTFLSGLIRYSKDFGPWNFYRIPTYYKTVYGEMGILEKIREWEIDAIISQWDYEDIRFLKQLKIPIFLQNYKETGNWFSKITGDYEAIGRMAASFFSKRCFTNFAFYGNRQYFWSMAREKSFREEVEKVNGDYYCFETESFDSTHWCESHVALKEWLVSLPKPIGLLACDDNFALLISEMCKICGISIPEEVSLLGVDNDELICQLAHPSISSIVTNDEIGGYNTGKMLHQLILSGKSTPFDINIDPIRIELRQSTEKYVITDPYVLKIVNYINENITSELTVKSLMDIVPLSRRSLELRFKETMHITLYQFVIEAKMQHIALLLTTTDKSIVDIAYSMGFNDVRNVYRLFQKQTGYTPAEYRKKYQK